MRISILAVFLIFTASVSVGMNISQGKKSRIGQTAEGFRVSATAKKEEIASGEPAILEIRTRNVSNSSLYLGDAGPERDYRVEIWGDTGKPILPTEHGKAVLEGGGRVYMNLSILMKPGQVHEDTLDISRLYDISTSGNYSITVSRKLGMLKGKLIEAQSNPVHIRVSK